MLISTKQWRVMRAIHDRSKEGWVCPSLREIGALLGAKSTHAAWEMVQRLVGKGWVEKLPVVSRAMRLTPEGLRVMELFEAMTSERARADGNTSFHVRYLESKLTNEWLVTQ